MRLFILLVVVCFLFSNCKTATVLPSASFSSTYPCFPCRLSSDTKPFYYDKTMCKVAEFREGIPYYLKGYLNYLKKYLNDSVVIPDYGDIGVVQRDDTITIRYTVIRGHDLNGFLLPFDFSAYEDWHEDMLLCHFLFIVIRNDEFIENTKVDCYVRFEMLAVSENGIQLYPFTYRIKSEYCGLCIYRCHNRSLINLSE